MGEKFIGIISIEARSIQNLFIYVILLVRSQIHFEIMPYLTEMTSKVQPGGRCQFHTLFVWIIFLKFK